MLGAPPDNIDVSTIIHDDINFDLAEQEMIITTLDDSTELNLVSYEFLKDAKKSHIGLKIGMTFQSLTR
jgi:hypothetical protein